MENITYQVYFTYNINSISCKLIESDYYLCAYNQNNKLYLVTLIHSYGSDYKKELKCYSSEYLVNDIPFHDKIILYNTDKKHYKILCVFDKNNNNILCIIVRCEKDGTNKYKNIEVKNFDSLTTKFSINEDNCYIIGFYSVHPLNWGLFECEVWSVELWYKS